MDINLHQYDWVIINSSAGKDSLAAIQEICRLAKEQNYNFNDIVVSHQDLGIAEWQGTKELAAKQAEHFGLDIYYTKRRNKAGYEETLLEYVERRGKWPANKERYCTSDFKRGPGQRVVTQLTADMAKSNVLYVMGFRAEESPARAKREVLKRDDNMSTKKRTVDVFLPIHDWSTKKVWQVIKDNDLPYHFAYDLGMPRLSCCFCIFSPFDALVLAGINNPELLDQYVGVEERIGHTFRKDLALADVKKAITEGYQPKKISNWTM